MKAIDSLRSKISGEAFVASFVCVMLFLLPISGAKTMLIGSAIALVAFILLFGFRLQKRVWLSVAFATVFAAMIGSATVIALR